MPAFELSAVGGADPFDIEADLLLLACGGQDDLARSPAIERADGRLGGMIRRAAGEESFHGKPGQVLVTGTSGVFRTRRLALLGVGNGDVSPTALRAAAANGVRLARSVGAARAVLAWTAAPGSVAATVEAAGEGALLGRYRFDKYITDERARPDALSTLTLAPLGPARTDELEAAAARARITARAVARARDLVNEPAGVLTPGRLASVTADWARAAGVTVDVLGRAECETLGMRLFLAVSRGSVEEPRFVHMAWAPAGASKRIVLVGKGVTFDSGGLSLKTNDGMLDMKTDMAGAAAVLAAVTAAAEEGIPIEVHGLAACTENMPSGSAYKLGDVIASLDGRTVEINNTDAEGRLTLADAISFGRRLRPDALLDFATLTGACVVALGPHTAGVMSNNDALAAAFLAAAEQAGEDAWRLPLPARLAEQLKSDVADLKNTGERWGGALTAGLFLKEFVGDVPWVHVDIAGPASAGKENGHVGKGGTGFGVASILRYLRAAAA